MDQHQKKNCDFRWIGRFLAFGIPFAMADTARRQVSCAIFFQSIFRLGSCSSSIHWVLCRIIVFSFGAGVQDMRADFLFFLSVSFLSFVPLI